MPPKPPTARWKPSCKNRFISLYKMLNAEKPVVDIGEFDFEKSLLKLLDEEDSDADMDDIDFEKKLEESLRDL